MWTRTASVLAVLCLGAVAPCSGFASAFVPTSIPRLARSSIRAGARHGLRMVEFDASAAAKEAMERSNQRERAREEKRRAREAREKEQRSAERCATQILSIQGRQFSI